MLQEDIAAERKAPKEDDQKKTKLADDNKTAATERYRKGKLQRVMPRRERMRQDDEEKTKVADDNKTAANEGEGRSRPRRRRRGKNSAR